MRLPQRQGGASLIVVLIVLAVLLIGAMALLRSGEISALVAGNVAFKEAATQGGEIGISTAARAIDAMTDMDTDVARTYYARRQPEDVQGLPTTVDWATVPAVTVGNGKVQYVIERMCTAAPVVDPVASCMVRERATSGSAKAGAPAYAGLAQVYYRVTVRVVGPKNTTSFLQALVVK
jgi:Tfp pilus assembly protein PilX